jgi:hypothetical protein
MKKILTFFLLFLSFLICLSTAKAFVVDSHLGNADVVDFIAWYNSYSGYTATSNLQSLSIEHDAYNSSALLLLMTQDTVCNNHVLLTLYVFNETSSAGNITALLPSLSPINLNPYIIAQSNPQLNTNISNINDGYNAKFYTFYFNKTINVQQNERLYYLIIPNESCDATNSKSIYVYGDLSGGKFFADSGSGLYGVYNYGGNYFPQYLLLSENTTNATSLILLNHTIFSSRQCVGNNHLCTDSYFDNHIANLPHWYDGVYCNIDNISVCAGGCYDYVYNLNTSEIAYFQLQNTCTVTISQQTTSPAWYNICTKLAEFYSTLNNYVGIFNDLPSLTQKCNNRFKVDVPTSSCVNNYDPFISTNDGEYIEGECYNETPIGDLCSPTLENKTVCADQLHYETCIRDFTGFLSWNVSQPCNSLGFQNYVCQAGRCVYVPPVTPPTPPNHPTTSKGVLYAGFLILIFLVLGACAYIGSITGNMGFGITLGIILDLLLLVGSAIDSFPVIGGLVSPSIIIIITIIGLAVIVVYAFIKINH